MSATSRLLGSGSVGLPDRRLEGDTGLELSGRVAVDVAGRRGWIATVLASAVVGLIGMAVQSAGEAHGDGISELQVGVAAAVVLVLTTGTALLVIRRRARRT